MIPVDAAFRALAPGRYAEFERRHDERNGYRSWKVALYLMAPVLGGLLLGLLLLMDSYVLLTERHIVLNRFGSLSDASRYAYEEVVALERAR